MAVIAAVFGVYLRFTGLSDVFCRSPDELAEIMPGLRLHGLPFFNLSAPLRYNFFQSMFYSQHGLGDVSFYYLTSGVLSLLHLPVSERFLDMASALTNLVLVGAGALLAWRVIGDRGTAWVFATLMLLSPHFVFVSKTGWGRLTWTPLLLVLVFVLQWLAMTRKGAWWPAAFALLAGFVALTDSFVILPVVPVLGLLIHQGSLAMRLRALVRDRAFLLGCAAIAAGVAIDLAIGLGAIRRGTDLTLMAYVILRGRHGGLIPSAAVFRAFTQCVDYYLSFHGAWLLAGAAFVFAAIEGVRGRVIGFVAAWWAIASLGVLRYAAALDAMSGQAPGPLNAYQLAVPSILLVAWLIATVASGSLPLVARIAAGPRAGFALALLLILTTLMTREAYAVSYDSAPSSHTGGIQLLQATGAPLSSCRMVKASALYVRSHATVPYVFHLTGSFTSYFGAIGEFYYGLSYGRGLRPEDPNRLLDFGPDQFGQNYPPQAFARAYNVPSFDYYIEFADDGDEYKASVITQLLREGAHLVCTVTDHGRPIGHIYSFHDEPPVQLQYRDAAASWDHQYGRAGTLLQPLAGTAYHFGYSWRKPE